MYSFIEDSTLFSMQSRNKQFMIMFATRIDYVDEDQALVIQSADGQAMRESSKEIWSTHWDTFKENLTAFWRINSNAIQNIPTSSESSLKEISEKYRMIGESTSFVGLQQLDKLTILWNSMNNLNSKTNTEVQMVSDAFRQLQYPVMTVDWQSIGLKFQECPVKFHEVDGALEAFLGEEKGTSTVPPQFSTEYSKPTEEEELETSESPLENFQMREIRFFLTADVCAVFWSNCNLFY